MEALATDDSTSPLCSGDWPTMLATSACQAGVFNVQQGFNAGLGQRRFATQGGSAPASGIK
jgi:hypothetical protein